MKLAHEVRRTDYNKGDAATGYQESTKLPFRDHLEKPTLLNALPAVLKGLSVLDLACGEGRVARWMVEAGASQVVGVDKFNAMIDLAEKEEKKNPQGIEYQCHDVENLGKIGQFDIATAVYLLHYADTPELLEAYCRNIFLNLKAGGTFVGLNLNMDLPLTQYGGYAQYDIDLSVPPRDRQPGDPVDIKVGPGEMTNYWLPAEVYEKAFRKAGFVDFAWHQPIVSEEGQQQQKAGYWNHFLKHPLVVGFSARKPE